jgi:alanine-glyoxylate transaminase / serine-glyoxylate transaminase / serine-pyruvate transaminase
MIDETLTLIPGPTPVHPRILAALARPTHSHLAPEVVAATRRCVEGLRSVCCLSGQPFIVAGGGTLAMELALVNTVSPGQRVLVISQGYFGERFGELAAAFGIETEVLRCSWGEVVPPEQVERALAQTSFAAVTITHVDTSTGAEAPAAEYCELLRQRDELVILDGVCATGGIAEPCDDWGVDIVITAPQKAFGAPPGLALAVLSERAMARRRALSRVPAFYADVLRWLPIMEDPGRYFGTPAVNNLFALDEALAMIMAEGLEARFERHRRVARGFRAGLAAIGLEPVTAAPALAATLSVLRVPQGIEDAQFRREVAARGVVLAGGLGPFAGKAFRLGHMGNIGPAELAAALTAIEDSLGALCVAVEPGAALAAAAPAMARR